MLRPGTAPHASVNGYRDEGESPDNVPEPGSGPQPLSRAERGGSTGDWELLDIAGGKYGRDKVAIVL